MSSMSEIWENSDGTRISNVPYHQTVAISRLGHGYDRQNQSSIKQGPYVDFGHYGLFHQMASKDVISFLKEHVIHRFGIPQTITTDGGSVFIYHEFREFCEDMGIKLIRSSPYYAQANGQAEASNQSLIKLIKRKVDEHPRRWHEVLSEALWAY